MTASVAPAVWRVRGRSITIDRPLVVGIVNVTPDSFSDGGRWLDPGAAAEHAERLVAEGADLLDVGGESTRPGAAPVHEDEELRRVLPVVRALVTRLAHVPVSVDTAKSAVARAALAEGAAVINDVSAFRLDPAMASVCAEAGAGVVLMHSRGTVTDMASYAHAHYGDDPTGEVVAALSTSVDAARAAGVSDASVVLDPGIGFGKRGEHSLRVLADLPRLAALGRPILIGASRKRFVGELTGAADPADRAEGSVGAHCAALALGARLFRVHDVRAHRRALDVAWAVLSRSRLVGNGA